MAKLALGGALKRDGWSEDRALAFARELYRHVPDGANLEADIRDNWRRDVTEQTGWSRLAELTRAPDVVSSVRELLGGGASLKARLAEVAERRDATAPAGSRYKPPADRTVSCGGIAFRVGQLEAKLPPLVYQVDGIFCKGDVIMLVAHGNSLKTWIAFSLALAVATGKPWLGKFPAVRGRVAVLDYESGDYEVVRRLQLLGAKDAEVGDRLLRASYSDAQLTDPETWIELAKLGLDLLVIDSFKAASPDVDENDARSARLLELAGQFADATGCTVLVIHHSRKGSGGDAREKVRGSTALFAACDRIFEFTEPDKKDGGIVETTMQPVKDGAGRRAGDVRVELSDQGLRWIEIPNEAPAEDNPKTMTLEKCKARALEILREAHRQGRMSGIPRRQLRNMLRGPNTLRDEAIESLELAGYTRAYTERVGRARTEFVMLHPHAERP
ncbi:MAG TPA: AAA family ATPase [Polyangiaceae bacterium]|nr:AAA family ATPase [Polyangiaceae bacterium]